MKHKFNLNFVILFAFSVGLMVIGRNEYLIIVERFVKLICTSCIGI